MQVADCTCIISTSPTMLSPQAQLIMLKHTVHSVWDCVGSMPVLVVCDGHKKPTMGTRQDKRGNVGFREATNYAEYKKKLLQEAGFDLLELPEHRGFGHAIAEAARRCCSTTYILVAQHDFMFNQAVHMSVVMEALASGDARYVVFPCGAKMVTQAKLLADHLKDMSEICVLPFNAYHDKNHVIAREVYLNEVMPHIKRGQFPEDVLTQNCRRQNPLWHQTFGIGLYFDPAQPRGCLAHLRGRQCRSPEDMLRHISIAKASCNSV